MILTNLERIYNNLKYFDIKNKDEEVDDEDWKSVIFPQIEEACEGMKKANLRI